MTETKHKIISNLLVTVGAFLGFQALSYVIGIYQVSSSLSVAFYVYAFHIFWLTFLFDLHFKKRGVWQQTFWIALRERVEHLKKWEYIRHYQNYLVLPGLIYWGTVVLLFLNPFRSVLKELLVIASTTAMSVAYWYMKEHVSARLEHKDHWLKVLSLVKLYAGFVVFASTMGVTFYFGFDATFLTSAVLTLTFLLVYQALFQHRMLTFKIFLWIIIMASIMALVSLWVYVNWSAEYFTAGLVMLAIYNTMWGILHHYLDKTLTRKVVFEYLIMAVFIVTFVFASHNFNQRVI